MGIMVYAFIWVMQDLYHQPYYQWPRSLHVSKARRLRTESCRIEITLRYENVYPAKARAYLLD